MTYTFHITNFALTREIRENF